jgi:LPXTG-motif cell wall-anchored protein
MRVIAGGGVFGTALVGAAGVPAQASPTCDETNTIAAVEAQLRNLLTTGVLPIICVTAGVIDFSSSGSDTTATPINISRSVTLIGLGDVVFDGKDESNFLTTSSSGANVNLTIDNITFQNGYTADVNVGSALNTTAPGALTVLNSTFTGNGGYGAIVSPAFGPTVDITNSLFADNGSLNADRGAAVYSYGDLTITNSTFLRNVGDASGAVVGNSTMTVSNNLFVQNTAQGSGGAVSSLVDSNAGGTVDISNNTFVSNTAGQYGGAVRLDRNASVANNTFVDNTASTGGNALYNTATTTGLFANIFASSTGTGAQLASTTALTDFAANVSTSPTDASLLATSALVTGQIGATYASISLSPLADNGGPTQTMALNAGSIAIDAATPAIRTAATAITQPTVDQRGVARGEASDAGAYEFVAPVAPPELADTGVSPLDALALAGGAALVGASALLVAKRRRRSV